jgi:hypothetical protein
MVKMGAAGSIRRTNCRVANWMGAFELDVRVGPCD